MIKYRKPGLRHFEVTGEVETLGGDKPYVYIKTSSRWEKRAVTRIEMTEDMVKQFIPYLYQVVTAKFIKGCVFITLN